METEFDLILEKKDMYEFLLQQGYTSGSSLIGTAAGCICILLYGSRGNALLLILGFFLLACFPWINYSEANKEKYREIYGRNVHYLLNEDGIFLNWEEGDKILKWEDVNKAISTRKSISLLMKDGGHLVFPRASLGDTTTALVQVISAKLPPKKVTIRGAI